MHLAPPTQARGRGSQLAGDMLQSLLPYACLLAFISTAAETVNCPKTGPVSTICCSQGPCMYVCELHDVSNVAGGGHGVAMSYDQYHSRELGKVS